MEANQYELNPSDEYIKGFNHGYNLQRYEPEKLRMIISAIKDENSDYKNGMRDGKAEMVLEMEREKYPNKKTIPGRIHNINRDIDHDLDR